MIIFKVKKKRYKLKNDWADWTLEQAAALAKIEQPEVTDPLDWFEHLDKVQEVWRMFFDGEAPESLHPAELVHFFTRFCLPLWDDLKSVVPMTYTPKGLISFTHKGVTYALPQTLSVGDITLPAYDMTAKQFVEAGNALMALQKMRKDGFVHFALFIAAIVAPKDDTPDKMAQRTQDFKDLPMPVVWEVFFYSLHYWTSSAKNILNYLDKEVQRKASRQASKFGFMRWRPQAWLATWKRLIT